MLNGQTSHYKNPNQTERSNSSYYGEDKKRKHLNQEEQLEHSPKKMRLGIENYIKKYGNIER